MQNPIGSGFNSASTASEVIKGIDLRSKTAIVTGGYSGIGLETARVLAEAGAKVIIPARDVPRAKEAAQGVGEVQQMDLLDPVSINRFADQFFKSGQRLDILVNSAGIMALKELEKDARGFEKQFSTNHLGHFQLTLQLRPAFNEGSRVVSVSSLGHRYSPVVFEDVNYEKRAYERWAAYGQSKTANILFAFELDKRWKSHGIRAFSLHPGAIVDTGLQKHLTQQELVAAGVLNDDGTPIRDPSRNMKTIPQGAATSVWCATSPRLNGLGGLYCENVDVAPMMASESVIRTNMADSRKLTGVLPYAIDPENAERLWTLSEKMLG